MTTPPYNPQIPLPNNTISDGQSAFLTNFSTIFSAFGTNHVALNDSTNPGNHSIIELVEQTTPKSTQSQEISIYSKKVVGQTDQLFMRESLNGREFQISNYQIYSIPQTATQKAFFTFLPGGIIVYFGTSFSVGKTSFNINLNPPVRTNIIGINLGGIDTISAQPNVSLTAPVDGFYTTVVLTSATAMPNQFYLIFSNL
jgi:hypothetical protein